MSKKQIVMKSNYDMFENAKNIGTAMRVGFDITSGSNLKYFSFPGRWIKYNDYENAFYAHLSANPSSKIIIRKAGDLGVDKILEYSDLNNIEVNKTNTNASMKFFNDIPNCGVTPYINIPGYMMDIIICAGGPPSERVHTGITAAGTLISFSGSYLWEIVEGIRYTEAYIVIKTYGDIKFS